MNYVADSNLLSLAIPITHNDAVKVNRISSHADLYGAKGSLIVDLNCVVVILTIHTSAAKVNPLTGLREA